MLALIGLAGLLDLLRQADARVAAVAWRLQTANVALCRDVAPSAGLTIDTLDQYPPGKRKEARVALGLADLPQIGAIVPAGAAARAGLVAGDEIVAVNDVAMPHAAGGPARYDDTAVVEKAITAGLSHPPVKLSLSSRTVYLTGDPACRSAVQLVPGGRLDAQADGEYVQISGAMYEFTTSDSELAFVVAHELAHNLFPEARRVARAGKGQRAAELAADRLAITMMTRAGYDARTAIPFLKRLSARANLSWLDGSHPAWGPRIAAAGMAVAAVSATQSVPTGIVEGHVQ